MEKIIIVVPCFNEEKRLHPSSFLNSLKVNKHLHWLFVDDGSQDGTPKLLQAMKDQAPGRIFFHQLEQNMGKGNAVRCGLLQSLNEGATLTGYYDADLSVPMSELLRCLGIFSTIEAKVLLAVRLRLLGRNIKRKEWRKWVSFFFVYFASWGLDARFCDTQCGMKLISHFPQLRDCLRTPFSSRWIFDLELIHRMVKVGQLNRSDFFEEPLLSWTDVEGSKIKIKDFFISFIDFLKILMESCSFGFKSSKN